jgi:hypothetical protein
LAIPQLYDKLIGIEPFSGEKMTDHNGIIPTSIDYLNISASPSSSKGNGNIVVFSMDHIFSGEFTPEEAEELAQAFLTAAAKARTEQNLDPWWIHDDEFIKIWHEKQAVQQEQV